MCIQFQVNSLQGLVHGIQDFASGRPASTHCSVNCVCSFKSIHYVAWFMGFGMSPLSVRQAHTAQHWTCNGTNHGYNGCLRGAPGVGGPGHTTRVCGTGTESQTDAGYCLEWQRVFTCLQGHGTVRRWTGTNHQGKSLQGLIHGICFFASGRPGSKHCLVIAPLLLYPHHVLIFVFFFCF